MEILNTLYNLMGLVFVLGMIVSMGLSLTVAQITGPLRNTHFVIMALLANFVVVPMAAYPLINRLGESRIYGNIYEATANKIPDTMELHGSE